MTENSPKISQKSPIALQIGKYIFVGVLNTAIDFGILNFLIWISKIEKGPYLILFNIISFSVAVINSYFWNKYWTFQGSAGRGETQFSQFILISVIGAVINTSIVFLISTYIHPPFGIQQQLWVNIGKVFATGVGLVWNFTGYKFWVFKK